MCPLDSDGDGLSNGTELGDPDCTWRPGDRIVNPDATHPGDPRDPDRCGNDELDPGEECDGDALHDETCIERGFMGGELSCHADCTVDDSMCEAFPEPDAEILDANVIDAAVPDVEVIDAMAFDAEVTEDMTVDESVIDARSVDLGEVDAELEDASVDLGDENLGDEGPAIPSLDAGQDDSGLEPPALPREQGGCSAALPPDTHWPGLILAGLLLTVTIRFRSSS